MEDQSNRKSPFTKTMALTLQAEEIALTAVGIYFLIQHSLGLSFWIWILIFLVPDISMFGYLFGNRIGAFSYNICHHRGLGLLVAAIGYFLHNELVLATGLLLFAHSSFDRMFGYGLKYPDSFNHTSHAWTGRALQPDIPVLNSPTGTRI